MVSRLTIPCITFSSVHVAFNQADGSMRAVIDPNAIEDRGDVTIVVDEALLGKAKRWMGEAEATAKWKVIGKYLAVPGNSIAKALDNTLAGLKTPQRLIPDSVLAPMEKLVTSLFGLQGRYGRINDSSMRNLLQTIPWASLKVESPSKDAPLPIITLVYGEDEQALRQAAAKR